MESEYDDPRYLAYTMARLRRSLRVAKAVKKTKDRVDKLVLLPVLIDQIGRNLQEAINLLVEDASMTYADNEDFFEDIGDEFDELSS